MSGFMEPELVFYAGSTLLEGPCWHKEGNGILFVSIEQNMVYYLRPDNGAVKTFLMDSQVGCAVFEDDRHILAAAYTGIYRIDIHTEKKEFIAQLNEDSSIRYNDGIMDVAGRFLVGTTGYNRLAKHQNFLYSWDGKNKRILLEGTTISNGIDFSKDNRFLYFVDTPTRRVSRFFYDIQTGDIRFDRHIITFTEESLPDGICTDTDDMLWVAQWGGFKVSKWNPYTGKKLAEITLPCKNVTSCCIGGAKGEWLFITTARQEDKTQCESLAGGLFKARIRD